LYPILIRLLFADGKLAALGGLIVVLEEWSRVLEMQQIAGVRG
jgi:hypothetical protein